MEASSDAISSQITGRRVALLSCGTFSPPTYMHLRMFERARDYLQKIHGCEVVEGIMSPVADRFGRPDIVSAKHRLKMVQLSVKSSSWIRADGWECSQGEWTRTIHVLRHFQKVLDFRHGNDSTGIRLLLLCGGDVIESITKLAVSDVMLWDIKQIEEVVRDFGIVVVMRANTDPAKAIYLADVLRAYQKNIFVIDDETCPNDVSSTRLRTAIRRNESIRYCINDEVIQYIKDNSLYEAAAASPPTVRMKLHSVCRSASSSSISGATATGSVITSSGIPVGSCLKRSKPSLPLKRATTATNTQDIHHHKQSGAHFAEDEKQSYSALTTSPIWCPSSSLPDRSPPSSGEFICSPHSLPPVSIRQTLPILTPNEQCSAEANVDSVSKAYGQTRFRSPGSPDYDNLTLDELLAASTGWADYLGAKKEEFHTHAEEIKEMPTTSRSHELEMPLSKTTERSILQKKMPSLSKIRNLKFSNPEEESKWKNYEMQSSEPASTSTVSRSVENLTEEPESEKRSKSHSLFQARSSEEAASKKNSGTSNVTLIYRKYKLASTPETTV